MSWHTVRLAELIDVKHGFPFKSEHYTDAGDFLLLTPGNCHESGGLKLRPGHDIYYEGEVPSAYLLRKGDLLVVMTDLVNTAPLLGGSLLIPEDGRYLHNQRLGLIEIKCDQSVDKRFLYYLFNTHGYRGQIRGSATGATVRHTAPDRIRRCTVRIPTRVATQRRIASILSAYDDLIENNRRRISLLEESARLLYREWFVNLRFPGHESTPIKDGLPEGWERTTLGDLADVQKGQNITKETVASGSVPVVAGGLEPAYLHDTANAAAPVITISASGANSGHVALYQQDIWASDCSYISGATTPHIFFVYLALKAQQLALTAMQLGAAQPHVYPKDIKRLAIPYPDDITLGRFTGTVAPMFLQVRCLQAQNSKLAAARDLLLPRLMSGEIEV